MKVIILCIFICLFTLANKICEKRSLSKVIANIYLLWWFVWLELSIDTKGTMIEVSNQTYWILILNVISFISMYLLVYKLYKSKSINSQNLFADKDSINRERELFSLTTYQSGGLVWLVGIFMTIILLYYLRRYNALLDQYGMNYARIIRYNLGYMLKSPVELLFYNYIVQSILSIITLLVPIHILNRKFKNPIIYIGIINIFLNSQIGKGRIMIFQFLLYFVITFVIFYYKEIWKYIKKSWYVIGIIIVIGGSSMVLLTLTRLNTDFGSIESIITNLQKTLNQVILYFTGSIRAFDYSLTNNYREIILSRYGYTWGGATFSGINEVIIMFFRGIGMEIPTINMVLGELTQPSIFIGKYIQYNAFYTVAFNYYIDFGLLGVALFSGLFGAVISFLVKKSVTSKDPYYTMVLTFNLFIMLFSLLRWEYQAPSTWFVIFIILAIRLIHIKWLCYCRSNSPKIFESERNTFVKKVLLIYEWILSDNKKIS